MVREGKRYKIDTRYIHHEKEDMLTRNTEQHSHQIPREKSVKYLVSTWTANYCWRKRRNNLTIKAKHVVVNRQEITTLSNEQTPSI
jgi:hypothetical protein